jgi:transcriptional regulator with XRE-family HTH domain
MPALSVSRFAQMLRKYRKAAGLSPSQLARYLNEDTSFIRELESGKRKPPAAAAFYEGFYEVPGFTDTEITGLLEAQRIDRAAEAFRNILAMQPIDPPEHGQGIPEELYPSIVHALVMHALEQRGVEAEQDPLTQFVLTKISEFGSMSVRELLQMLDFPPKTMPNPESPTHYPHTSVPDHASRLVGEGKFQKAKARRRPRATYEKPQLQEGEQPERLMTVQEVIDILQLPPSTVWTWLATGRLKERGRIWHVEPGGRSSPLVSQSEAEYLNNNRPPMGRPRKRKV